MNINLKLYVKPGTKFNKILGFKEIMGQNYLFIQITKQAKDNEANLFIIYFFARLFDLTKKDITIKNGLKTKYKTLRIASISQDKFDQTLKLHISK